MFGRVLFFGVGRLPQPLRAGDGFVANVAPVNFNTESDETITTAQLSGGSIHQGLTLTSDVVYTLPTAELIVAETGEMDVGDAFTFNVSNSQAGAFDVVMAVGAGITAVGTNNNLSVAPQSGKMFHLVKTGAATFDLY